MNRSIRTTALVAVAASAVLTGCAGTVDRNKDVEAAAPTLVEPPEIIEPETTFPTPTRVGPPTNERGNIEAALGDEGTLSDLESGTPVVTYAIDAIGPVQCRPDHYEYGSSPENGNLIAVDMRVSTAPELAQSDFGSICGPLQPHHQELFFVDGREVRPSEWAPIIAANG